VGTERDTVTSSESTKLFTCYEAAPKVSFYMYLSPLKKTAWLLFSIQAVTMWLLLNLFVISKDIKTSFSPLLFSPGIGVKDPCMNYLSDTKRSTRW